MGNGYYVDSLATNPYFLNGFYSPSLYSQQYNQGQVSTNATAANEGLQNSNENKSYEDVLGTSTSEKKSSSSTAKFVLGAVATIGAGLLCKKAYGMGEAGKGFWKQLGSGFKEMSSKTLSWGKGVKDKVVNPEKFSVTRIGEETVCTIPNRRNLIKGAEGFAQIGSATEAPAILDSTGKLVEGIKIKNGTFRFDGKNFIVTNGKITGCENMSKEAFRDYYTIPKTQTRIDFKQKINEKLADFMKGETGTVTKYSHTQDGVARLFERGSDGVFNLKCGVSNRFNVNSDAVWAYRHDNTAVENVLKGFAENKTDGLKLASAEFTRNDIGTLYIKNGEISAIKWTDGETYKKGSEKWKSLIQQNKAVYENILKDQNCLENKIYQAA